MVFLALKLVFLVSYFRQGREGCESDQVNILRKTIPFYHVSTIGDWDTHAIQRLLPDR